MNRNQINKPIFIILLGLVLAPSIQAAQYIYDDLNRLIQVIYQSGKTLNYSYDPAGNLLSITTSDQQPTNCLLYAVHDEGQKDTQLFTINPNQNFDVQLLGQLHQAKDLEALDIHPETNQLFAAAGDDGTPPGMLYTVNTSTGDISPVNQIGTGFHEINGLSFKPDGTLWAIAEGEGLIQIDPTTGLGTLALAYNGPIEDLTWDNQGTTLYGIQQNQLLAYSPATNELSELNCQLPGGEVEAIEMLPDGRLLFAIHNDKNLSIHALDIETCQLIGAQISTRIDGLKLNDIEGIAWPIEACSN